MHISVFDLFKIGIGPSSSHTVGPMSAAADFVSTTLTDTQQSRVQRIQVTLHGSLSATGRGHGTDVAVMGGLAGARPDSVDPAWLWSLPDRLRSGVSLWPDRTLGFDPDTDIAFDDTPLAYHPNAMTLVAFLSDGCEVTETFYSVGGGFVVTETEASKGHLFSQDADLPYAFADAHTLLNLCRETGLRISDLMWANECARRPEAEVRTGLHAIWQAMHDCIDTGLATEGTLPGGLDVARRAHRFHASLQQARGRNVIANTLGAMDWVNLYALAVNEENAAGGRMVTAPTNGAAGIVPAVLMYYLTFSDRLNSDDIIPFLLTASAVGGLCKLNASISGAEVGCQGEVGSACAMAAAGLTEVLGGTPAQVENAAEIALEHNLGLTCDPIGGLVQVPCIERNAIAAVKAINAAQMALRGDGSHFVSLDKAITTMRETGKDMQDKYKETSKGGLAVNVIEC
ncbi:L-serine ammonia-lyase [Saccharospirillum salsuginis]|uniref:L-serine dehydratase n=1 Tax=Saccharospirillum salsuginis TaxID=418750 RepID=A0A918KQ66_9GAMM|nr:L-serine ammonia-lyase [Saccharospirillum salsuginis]GGX71837.1 L-serine dehydratase [Saccharospirillum salsuginis]